MNDTKVQYLENVRQDFETSPFWTFAGLQTQKLEEGSVELYLPYRKEYDNVRGTIHGGIYMSVLDTTMGMLCRSLGSDDVMTIQMATQFLKPVKEEAVYSRASVINRSRSTALVEAKLFNEKDEMVAHCTATFKLK
ncbi:PaaI family thioesterase [Sporosarcina sp. PTS2304]|uniref:PaaI family thioesterase n=1 Tax=Sporosarcina sp. PTS2304 TaxID=2283194 RepID=UPI000E0CDDB1|nr:PaaI family thioesterase [Sporosarcina sp. PTS2304]AXH99975.1 PaaI family thioesterase [Sporosarcina sp. PTS2304]